MRHMSYYIRQIQNNKHNHYKYHYLDHMTTVIDIRDNYWSFAIDLYSINDFNLPVNSLSGDLVLPYQTISNIAFNLNSDQSKAKEGVVYNKDYAHLYSGSFDVDISQNEFFKQDLNNVQIDFALNLFIDPEAAKAAGSEVKQEDLDNLINETSEQRWDFVAYYSNTNMINQTGSIENITGFSLPSGNECIPISRTLDISIPQLNDLTKPFNQLAQITSLTPFQILSGKIKFNYWLELETQIKSLDKVLELDHEVVNDLTINLNDYTIYDFEKNEVIFNPIGLLGFNIPKYAQGYYELELLVCQEQVISKLVIRNQFNFVQNQIEPYISVASKTINSLEGYKEVKFYES